MPCVVAVRLKEQLHDVAAIEFTKQFYVAIASGHTVRQAFEIGEQAVRVAPELNKQASIHTDPRARSSPLTCRMLRVQAPSCACRRYQIDLDPDLRAIRSGFLKEASRIEVSNLDRIDMASRHRLLAPTLTWLVSLNTSFKNK